MKHTLELVAGLKPGQRVQIDWRLLAADFPPRRCNGAQFQPPDELLESVMGSVFEYGYIDDPRKKVTTFFRLEKPTEDSNTLSYVSPDYRRYYTFDGSLYRRNNVPYVRETTSDG